MSNDLGNRIDLICQHSMDGSVIPIKMRVRDEDGELQVFTVKSFRDMSEHGLQSFECKILVQNTMKLITIFSHNYYEWYIKKQDN